MSFEYSFMVIILGDYGVGRSLLFQRFTDTISVKFENKIVNINGVSIQLQVWDSSLPEKYWKRRITYYRAIAAAILVYDVSRKKSFDELNLWINDTDNNTPFIAVKILVGNKADKQSERKVLFEEAQTFANSHDMICLETSAITGLNVNNVFNCVAAEILMKLRKGELNPILGRKCIKFI